MSHLRSTQQPISSNSTWTPLPRHSENAGVLPWHVPTVAPANSRWVTTFFSTGLICLCSHYPQCRPSESGEGTPCERCKNESHKCEFRPVDQSSTSNSHALNYPIQDDPVNLYPVGSAYPVSSALPENQFTPSVPSTNQQHWAHPHSNFLPQSGGYSSNQAPYCPSMQTYLHTNPPYYSPSYGQPISQPSYPNTQQGYHALPGYSIGQHSYPHTNQSMTPYAPAQAPGPYHQHRWIYFWKYENWLVLTPILILSVYQFDNYENQTGDYLEPPTE